MLRPCLVALGGALLVAGCGSGAPAAGARVSTVQVTLDDRGCTVSPASVPAGPVTVAVANGGTSKVTEAELLRGDRVLGEQENLAPGLDGTFTVRLDPGSYLLRCPGGSGPQDQPLTVTRGAAPGSAGSPAAEPDAAEQREAARLYADYVRAQVADGIAATKRLTDAVRAGDLADAAAAYPPARVGYERIEPVAESFGDLDPAVDARAGDVAPGTAWTGYHRLEHAIFAERRLAGLAPVATRLDRDLGRLQRLVARETYEATDLANGASELLSEVARSKITGEEETDAHCDLVDFQANVDGARRAFELLRPALVRRDAALAAQIGRAFDAVDAGLAPFRTGRGPADFRPYTAVSRGQQHALAGRVDALAEPLSRVAAVLVRQPATR